MARLTSDDIRGVWAGITLSWDDKFRLDASLYEANLRRGVVAQVHGIYTTGSTGEFYVLEYEEFRTMVDIATEVCGDAGMPLQIGCCSDGTAKTIRLIEYAASKEVVGAVQVNLPYWMALNDREVLQFFMDLYTACPDIPIVHYNIPRAKRFLLGRDYARILEVAPSLVGAKFTFAGSHFGQLQDSIIATPDLSYFVGENLLVSGMLLGARGVYSSLVCTNPDWMLEMYRKAELRQWEEAIELQQHAAVFFGELEEFIGASAIDCCQAPSNHLR